GDGKGDNSSCKSTDRIAGKGAKVPFKNVGHVFIHASPFVECRCSTNIKRLSRLVLNPFIDKVELVIIDAIDKRNYPQRLEQCRYALGLHKEKLNRIANSSGSRLLIEKRLRIVRLPTASRLQRFNYLFLVRVWIR